MARIAAQPRGPDAQNDGNGTGAVKPRSMNDLGAGRFPKFHATWSAPRRPRRRPRAGKPRRVQVRKGARMCPHCSATLEPEAGHCPNCGPSVLDQGEALEAKVTRALAILHLDENDKDALSTLRAHLRLDGKIQESLETLNRLSLLDSGCHGLWGVKAQIFLKRGNQHAVKSAMARAQQGDEELERDR